jgi:RND family efflux transporter MFP subunit
MCLRVERLILVCSLAIVAVGCRQTTAPPAQEPPPPRVTVSRPVTRSITEFHEFTGETEAIESVDVRARVRGFLLEVAFQEGAEVKQGDLLYRIDPASYQAEVDRTEAEISRAEAQVTLTRSEEQRAKRLRASATVSEEEYQQRVAARQQAEASLLQARAAVEVAKLDLGYTRIEAPISGRIGRTLVTTGNLVGYNEPTLLTTIVAMDPIYVYFDATERGLLDYERRIREEGAARANERKIPLYVGLENEEGYPHEGIIDFRENRVDPGTGTILIRGVLDNDNRTITPGMFARVRVPIGAPREQLLVPQVAVGSDQGGDYVLIVDDEGRVAQRPVTLGQRLGEFVVISKGLAATDSVVVNGVQKARPGSQVTAQTKTLQVPENVSMQNSGSPGKQ